MMKDTPLSYEQLQKNSYLAGANAPYIEALYDQYLQDPNAVDEKWRQYFDSIVNGSGDVSHYAIQQQFQALAKKPATASVTVTASSQQVATDY